MRTTRVSVGNVRVVGVLVLGYVLVYRLLRPVQVVLGNVQVVIAVVVVVPVVNICVSHVGVVAVVGMDEVRLIKVIRVVRVAVPVVRVVGVGLVYVILVVRMSRRVLVQVLLDIYRVVIVNGVVSIEPLFVPILMLESLTVVHMAFSPGLNDRKMHVNSCPRVFRVICVIRIVQVAASSIAVIGGTRYSSLGKHRTGISARKGSEIRVRRASRTVCMDRAV